MHYIWIIYNGFYNGTSAPSAVRSLGESALKQGLSPILIANHQLTPIIKDGVFSLADHLYPTPKFIIFWDKDIRLAIHLEKMGYRVHNSSKAIEQCDNKSITYQVLNDKGIVIPKTIIAPFQYPNSPYVNRTTYQNMADEIGYPLIIKESFGTFGHQVYYIENEEEMLSKVSSLQEKSFLFQEIIQTSIGRDVRIQVVGDTCVASMIRFSGKNDKLAITQIGSTEAYEPTKKESELAISASKVLGLDFAGVDILFGENGEPVICELNSNGNMQNLLKASGVNVADKIISHLKSINILYK